MSKIDFLRTRWKWTILGVIALHLLQGILLIQTESAGYATSLSSLLQLIPNHIIAGAVMVIAALLSIYQLATDWSKWLLLPQLIILIIAAGGVGRAIWLSAFADGIVRSRAFIAADQLIYIILPLLYGIIVMEIYEPRVRINLGK